MKIKFFLIFFFLLTLSSCGFKPILAKSSEGSIVLNNIQLVSVEGEDQPRLNRIISEELGHSNNPKYQLKIQVNEEISSIGILKDGQSTRYKVKVTFNYQLLTIDKQEQIDAGSVFLYSSYDVPQSEFANYISERSVSDNLVKALCDELKTRLMLVLSSRGEV